MKAMLLTTLRSHFLVLALVSFSSIASSQVQAPTSSSARFIAARAEGQGTGRVSHFAHVRVEGPITVDTPRALLSALEEARRSSTHTSMGGKQVIYVFLDSPGGHVGAAVAMGRILRANAADVWVDRDASCSSACIFVLAGGVSRWAVPGSRLGLHRPYFEPRIFAGLTYEDSQKKYGQLASAVKFYLLEMGIAAELFEMMMRIPSDDLIDLDHEVAEKTNLLGNDPAHDEWDRARYAQRTALYEKCLRQGGSELDCQVHLRPSNKPK